MERLRLLLYPFIVCGLTCCVQVVRCQSKFSFGPELGMNSSMFPKSENYGEGKEKFIPLVSPVLGICINYSKEHVFFSWGLQYCKVGQRYYYHRNKYDRLNQMSNVYNIKESFIFNQVAIPVLFGYNFKIARMPFRGFIGYKIIYFGKSQYNYVEEYSDAFDIGRNIRVEKKFSPFDYTLEIPAQRKTGEFVVGAGAQISDALFISLNFSLRVKQIYFKEKPTTGAYWDDPSFDHHYSRSDMALVLRYSINNLFDR
jgi:hypothetical protein